MTRFPHMRRLMIASAIIAPCLIFAAVLLFAYGSGWGICAFVIGLMIAVMFPAGIIYPRANTNHEATTGSAPVVKWAWRIAMVCLWIWLIQQPEFSSLLRRISDERALLDRWIIVPFAIFTTTVIYDGVRRVLRLTDEAIYRYLAGGER